MSSLSGPQGTPLWRLRNRQRSRDITAGPESRLFFLTNRLISGEDNGHIDEFRIAHVQRSDGWIETTWNNMSNLGAFAAAAAEEQEGGDGEPPPLAGAGVVVCLMG
jgi:hypothetical protein